MRRGIIAGIILSFSAGPAFAAPFLIADVLDPNADTCMYKAHGATTFVEFAVTVDTKNGNTKYGNRVCRVDVMNAPIGTNNVELAVRDSKGVWGQSASAPFSFVRPDLTTPGVSSIRLVP